MQNKYKHRYMVMIIVSAEDFYSSYTFGIIPSYNGIEPSINPNDYTLQLVSEETKFTYATINATNIFVFNDITYLSFEIFVFTYKESCFFTAKFFLDNRLIYKDKIFTTSQDKNTYSINNGTYTTPNIDNNDYIII